MPPSYFPPSHGYVDVKPDPRIIERLERKVRAAENLCKALQEWLCFEASESLADATRPYTPPPSFVPTPEMLVEAQDNLERARKKLKGIQQIIDDKDNPMAEFLEAVFVPDCEREIAYAEHQVSNLQTQMEQAAKQSPSET